MSHLRELMAEADDAKRTALTDRAAGEREFRRILAAHPNDGMVYFKRGEAYEVLGEKELAAGYHRKAEGLFPLENWKARARQALSRVTA